MERRMGGPPVPILARRACATIAPMKRIPTRVVASLVLLAVIWAVRTYRKTDDGAPPRSGPEAQAPAPGTTTGLAADALARAVREKRSKVWVEGEGRIVHLLKDDRDPPRHQRCLAEILDGHTIKISHNIDLAPRVPWRKGQTVRFRGRFEWNDKGGVVHWTHHDPKGRHEGGWLELAGQRYR